MKLEAGAGPPIENPTDEQISEGLSAVDAEQGGFVILSRGTQTYLQAHGSPEEGFSLEYRDGSPDDHYRSRSSDTSLQTTIDVFQAYRRDDADWGEAVEWTEVDIDRAPEEGVGCLTALLMAGTALLLTGFVLG